MPESWFVWQLWLGQLWPGHALTGLLSKRVWVGMTWWLGLGESRASSQVTERSCGASMSSRLVRQEAGMQIGEP